MNSSERGASSATLRHLLNRVPEVTVFFWIIKVLGTTVGETAADFLNVNLNLGLTVTSIVMGALLAVALVFQFRARRYVPGIYWAAVVLISVFGTLVTDNLTDALGVPLEASTLIFGALLAITFWVWYAKEKTLSMHSVVTARRESFYWLTILFTFALGTASGDLMAEGLGLGYLATGAIVAGAIAVLAFAWRKGLDPILSFWLIYILTRPLGASIGDLLTQPAKYGGLGLGATTTTVIFVAAIVGSVAFLAATRKDVTKEAVVEREVKTGASHRGAGRQVLATLSVILILAGVGYYWRQSSLQASLAESAAQVGATSTAAAKVSPLGDVSSLRTIVQDTLDLVNRGDLAGAKTRIADLEFEWDSDEASMKPKNPAKWAEVDGLSDAALRQLRAVSPTQAGSRAALESLLAALG